MRRVSVVGVSGSGKTTLARALAARLGVPHTELDSVYHQRDWQPLPIDQMRARVAGLVAADGWVIDGNYSGVRDLVWTRADTVVFYDLPRRTVMRQVLLRTVVRGVTRRELWNGNRENLLNLLRIDPEHSVVRWSWVHHPLTRAKIITAMADPAYSHLRLVRLTSQAAAREFLASG